MKKRDQRTYVIIGLCAILLVMGIGYAAFSQLLTINGTATVSNSWCVGFDNTKTNTYQITKGVSTGTNPTGSMTYSGTACSSTLQPTSTLSSVFYQPGDQIEYTLTIQNASTVPVAIKSILIDNQSVTTDTTITKGNVQYIVKMPESTNIAVSSSTTMKVTAKFQNDTDVTGPYAGNETQTIQVKINAEQGDGTDGMNITPASFTGTIYRWSNTQLANKGSSSASTYPYTITNLTEGTDYVKNASLLNKNYYLKHDIVNDEIINSYVCFIYNNSEHCMKGADGGASFATNTGIIQDFQTFYNLGEYSEYVGVERGCKYNSTLSACYANLMDLPFNSVSASTTGVLVSDNNGLCTIDSNSGSHC